MRERADRPAPESTPAPRADRGWGDAPRARKRPWYEAPGWVNYFHHHASRVASLGPSSPLPPRVVARYGALYDHDFSAVRVRREPEAQRAAEQLNARAFTVGHDVAFARGQYDPDSPRGQHLIAHELAHVVQQARGGGAPAPDGDAAGERAAAHAAHAALSGMRVAVGGATAVGPAREAVPQVSEADPRGLDDGRLLREI